MTELIHEKSKFFLHGVNDKVLINILLIYGLIVTGFGVLLIFDVLTFSLTTHIDTVQPVTRNIIDYHPVEVKMPTLPMGPSWNGSSGGDIPQYVEYQSYFIPLIGIKLIKRIKPLGFNL